MTAERPSALREQAELQRLLRGLGQLGQSTSSPRTPGEEHSREERMAARIDQQLAALTARRSSRRLGFAVLAAAAVVLSLGGARYLRWDAGQLTIEQEPLAAGKEAKPIAVPSAVTLEPLPPAPPRGPPTARAGGDSPAESAAKPAPSAGPVAAQAARSGNPILPGKYADPEAHVFGNEYWIYPTYSAPYDQQTFMDAFSSKDLVTWTKRPRVLDVADVPWARRAHRPSWRCCVVPALQRLPR